MGKSLKEYCEYLRKKGLTVEEVNTEGVADKEVAFISCDSQHVKRNTLFICKGENFKDEYLRDAIEKGAFCYVKESFGEYGNREAKDEEKNAERKWDFPCITVNDIRKAMSLISGYFYDYVWNEKLNMVGITGTKGKSTTAVFVKSVIDDYCQEKNLKKCGFLSGIYNYDGEKTDKAPSLTTPETMELHGNLQRCIKNGCNFHVMEVSSQALKYMRTEALKYKIGVFLNIGSDHISDKEHASFEDYLHSKLLIFDQCDKAIINLEAEKEHLDTILKYAREHCGNIITFGKKTECSYRGEIIKEEAEKITFKVIHSNFTERFTINMGGEYNFLNGLGAVAICSELGIPIKNIKKGLAKAKVPGRMEMYHLEDKDVVVIVDNAHNAMSYEALFKSIKKNYRERKIIFLFGCVGGKAYNRRREGGIIADREADFIVLTERSPGNERAIDICNEINSYITNKAKVKIITDREKAIKFSLERSSDGCVVVVAGDGHVERHGEIFKDSDIVEEYIFEHKMM